MPTRYTKTQRILKLLLGLALLVAGIAHLTFARIEFQTQVPNWVPMSKDLVVVLSGFVEIGMGLALLLLEKYRIPIGWITAIFFVMVFPGNIAQWLNHRNAFGLDTHSRLFARLFFQPFFVVWALWSTGAWQARRRV